MSLSNSVFVSDEFTAFSSAGNESIGRVMEVNQNVDSVSSSATLSCMKDSNEAAIDVEIEGTERAIERISLRLGYNWVNPKVREFFSRYRSSSALSDFLSKIYIYSPNAVEEIIFFRHVGPSTMFIMAVKMIVVNFSIFMNVFLLTFMLGFL